MRDREDLLKKFGKKLGDKATETGADESGLELTSFGKAMLWIMGAFVLLTILLNTPLVVLIICSIVFLMLGGLLWASM